jgi:23S rRNA pseudouridine955/2504/2580 synthase/23S rRNA pseudouridine1911/1915/1917 synthase
MNDARCLLTWKVSSDESGIKLLAFLSGCLKGKYSSRFLKRLIENNACEINGRTERFASSTLGVGDLVSLYLQQDPASISSAAEQERILFEDGSFLVYNKPAGVVCDERGILQLWKSTLPSLKLVHRLDRETTGVLVFAKEQAIFDHLVHQFKNFQVKKSYLAIIDGFIEPQKGKIENYLEKKRTYAGQAIWGSSALDQGLYACTEWKELKRGKNASLIACYPKTGRTHQIRIHLAEQGHPILGDFQYGKHFQSTYRPQRILLHAEAIQFYHPLTGETMTFTAPLPEDFKIALSLTL